jgi:Rrf2 family iron-sulfur cluster assembly transcriptional regulator
MMLTSKARYGVIAMVELALQPVGRPVNLNEISQRHQITVKYLEQIFNKLKQKNLVKATKGPGGGYSLNIEANKIYIFHIIAAVDEQIKMTRCKVPTSGCVNGKTKCITHDLWEGLSNQIYNYLNNITLQDICERKLSKPYIEFHNVSMANL